jgi:cytochrome P450
MTDKALPTILQLTPLDETYRADPHAVLDDLRARCPVHKDTMSGNLYLTRYEDVRGLVSDRTLWRDPLKADASSPMAQRFAERIPEGAARAETTSILMLDDPDHKRIREPLTKAFYARIAKARPQVEQVVDAALDAIDASGPFDLMSTFCVPVPIDAIASILGVDPDRLPEFREWSEGVILSLNPFRTDEQTAVMEAASAALRDYFHATIIERRTAPRDDLISDMTQLQADGADLSDVELQINLGALLVGGNLTTTDLIGNAVRNLLLNPVELAKLKADPSLIAAVVEETLRFEGPVDVTGRVASREMEIGGCPVHQTQPITFQLRAANHDPAAFDDPHSFDISKKRKPHVAFGGGAHICIGAPLARMESQVALLKLFERFPNLRLADPSVAPEWRRLPFFRGLERLDLQA